MAVVWGCEALFGWLTPLQQTLTAASVRQLPAPVIKEVLLVAIDEPSIEALGPWPWPRELHARLIDRLTEADAGAVAYTVPWNGPEPREALNQLSLLAKAVAADPQLAEHAELTGWMQQSQVLLDGDSRLTQSLQQNRRTVLAVGPASSIDSGWPLASLASAAAGLGHLSVSADSDGIARSLPLLEARGDRWLPALALAAVAVWQHEPVSGLRWERDPWEGRAAVLGGARWPVDADGQIAPIWPCSKEASQASACIPEWSAAALLAGKLPPNGLHDRLVVVGLQTPDAAAGWHATAAGPRSTAQTVAATAAALIHAQVLARPLWTRLVTALCVIAVTLYLVVLLPRLRPSSGLAMSALWMVLMVAGAHLAVLSLHTEVPVALPITALLAGHFAVTRTRRERPIAPPTLPDRSTATQAAPMTATHSAPTQPAALTPDDRPATPHAPRPLVGDFELQDEIGRGAMGRVYRAVQRSSGDIVAVKTLALAREFDGFALQEAQQRFQREAIAASRLQHPDIVRILNTGDQQGVVWIAMELLHGHDLVRHTTDGHLLPVPLALEVCARIASALAHAHAHGVVHRDVKPANVMVDLDPALRRRPGVKVTDFGIARITDAARTRTGLVLGSPSYMSPEHLAGRAVDGRSDLYSLGVVLFQMLTGQLPFQGSSMAELMHAVAQLPAPDVRSLRPRLPEAVSNIVALALEKRPELRYADGEQMALDLRAVAALWPPMWAPAPERERAPAAGPASTTV